MSLIHIPTSTADPFFSTVKRFPNALITIRAAATTRKRPQEGDRRFFRGAWHVRRQMRTTDGCRMVRNGSPLYEWVREPSTPTPSTPLPQCPNPLPQAN